VKDTGGIITVRSELGDPNHEDNNRALKLWKEYDDTMFKLPCEKRGAWLQEHRADVIQRLNVEYGGKHMPDRTMGGERCFGRRQI
jgi:fatty acid synthase subunit alpha, fungi type